MGLYVYEPDRIFIYLAKDPKRSWGQLVGYSPLFTSRNACLVSFCLGLLLLPRLTQYYCYCQSSVTSSAVYQQQFQVCVSVVSINQTMCAMCESGTVKVPTELSLTCSFGLVNCTICESVLVKVLTEHNQTYSAKLIIIINQAQPHAL